MTLPMARAAPVEVGMTERAQVLVGQVEDALVVGIGVDGGHEALLDTEGVQKHLHDRSQTVGGAGGQGDDVVLGGVVIGVVDAHDHGEVALLAGGADQDLLGPLV
jgi:ABC-type uncharacterized transport system permease subunit